MGTGGTIGLLGVLVFVVPGTLLPTELIEAVDTFR